jgi:hypothetical protein
MRITFRQGLIAFQKDNGAPQFLQASSTTSYVTHVVSPTATVITFAHGSSDYLTTFDTQVETAWGPVTAGVTNYLYWDMDLLTGAITRGITLHPPISSLTAPSSPSNDQHWFDLSTTTMKVWSTSKNKWMPKIRLFAGYVSNGNTSQITMYGEGSQVGLTTATPVGAGYIVRDTLLNPMRKSSGEFLTTEDKTHVDATVGTSGVLVQPVNRVSVVRAGENIPAMSLVYFSGDDVVKLASSNPALSPARVPVGIMLEAVASGDVGVLSPFGEISYDQWDWSGFAGSALYCDTNGQLTRTRPAGLLAYRVGFIKNPTTVLLDLDAETNPQVYTADVNSLVISGISPVVTTDTINGLGERVVTIGVPNSTLTSSGLMSAAQAVQLDSFNTRITAAEQEIVVLETSKSDVGHMHAIADVTNLQTTIDGINTALNGKVDKVVGVIGNFPAFGASGSIVDSTFSGSSFALVIHTHTIADVTGLQNALNGKSNRVHFNSFAEIYETVDRTSSVDVGSGNTLVTALALKSNVGHMHAISDVSGLQTELDGKSNVGHLHTIADVSGLQTELNNRAYVSHSHTPASITGGTAGQVIVSNGTAGTWSTVSFETPVAPGTVTQYYRGDKTWQTLNKTAVGLDQVDNTTDLNKPISTATQAALDLKSNVGHTHVAADITDFVSATDTEINAHLAAGENISFSTVAGHLVISGQGGYVYKPVHLVTTENIDLQTPPTTIDGVAIPNHGRVLVQAQTVHSENGIYVYQEGALVRSADMPVGASLVFGSLVYALSGTAFGGSLFAVTSDDQIALTSIVVGTDGIAFKHVASGATGSSLTVLDTEAGLNEDFPSTGSVETLTFGNGLKVYTAAPNSVEVISVIKTRTLNLNIDNV